MALHWQNMANVLIILLPATFLCLAPLRVLFVFLAVTSVVFFLTVMANDMAAVLGGNIPKDSIRLAAKSIAVTPLENACYLVFFAVGTPLACWLLQRYIAPVAADEAISGWGQICVLPAAYCVLAFRAALPARVYPSQRLVFMAILAAFALYTYAMLLQMLKRNADATRKAERAQNAENILQIQGAEYERLAQRLEQARQARHDQRHQYAVLQGLAAQGNTPGVAAYLKELAGALPGLDYKTYCQNPAVNAVVNHYAAQAETAGINVDVRLDVPERLGRVSDSDLCVMVGNLLENAVEACCRPGQPGGGRWIRARAGLHGQNSHRFVLVVDNSFEGALQADGATGGYLSLKRPGQKGIGLQSVRAVCEKYDGYCEFEKVGGAFQSSVTLKVQA